MITHPALDNPALSLGDHILSLRIQRREEGIHIRRHSQLPVGLLCHCLDMALPLCSSGSIKWRWSGFPKMVPRSWKEQEREFKNQISGQGTNNYQRNCEWDCTENDESGLLKRKWPSLFWINPTRVEVNLSRFTDPSAPSKLEKVKAIPPQRLHRNPGNLSFHLKSLQKFLLSSLSHCLL